MIDSTNSPSNFTHLLYFQFYKDYEIPTEYEYLWRYLGNAYETEAMHQSTPADREIIRHYESSSKGKSRKSASLMKDERTFSIPVAGGVVQRNGGGASGDSNRSSVASSAEPEPAPPAEPEEVERTSEPDAAPAEEQQPEVESEPEAAAENGGENEQEPAENGDWIKKTWFK